MKCPFCGDTDTRVVDSRATDENSAIRRRRECVNCDERFTTYERVEETPIIVIKKTGETELFNRTKIITGLLKACEKRDITRARLEDIVLKIEQEIRNRMVPDISSREIGNLVMKYLRELDEVAYVRFASVYKRFTDLNTFRQELDRLQQGDTEDDSD